MFSKQKETQKLLEVSRRNLKEAEDKAEKLRNERNKLKRLVVDIAIIQNEKGQGTLVERYDKIKMLVDNYQLNN